jgi:hypothetical protein
LLIVLAGVAGPLRGATLVELRSLQSALETAKSDYARRAPRLSATEASDYSLYIARLRDRLAVTCAAYSLSHSTVPGDIHCPQSMPGSLSPADIDQRRESTRAETTSTLDAELDAGLGEFDERLLREQQRVKAAAPRSATGSGSGQAGTTEGGSGQAGTTDDGGASGAVAATGKTGSQQPSGMETSSDAAAGRPGQDQVVSGRPADIPDGSDDDVVARQLREAAEKETDPQLKKKLWEEYRNYKRGTQ